MRRAAFLLPLALFAAACATDGASEPTQPPTSPPPVAPPGELLACSDVEPVSAPDDWYRDTPVYVGNDQPVEQIVEWAVARPGYQTVWIDRDHNGWVTVAFTSDATTRQRELLEAFPGVGVVAVEVSWSVAALRTLQDRVAGELRGVLDNYSVSTNELGGVVELSVGRLTEELRADLIARYGGQPLCVSAADPATLPPEGPQPPAGEGWTLLVARKDVGRTYHTAIATDAGQLAEMWAEIGLEGVAPDVDFDTHVVIWFGAVYGSGCDDLRLDDVVISGATVHAEIVLPGVPVACAGDANPFAFVVAFERSMLPPGPFAIQLDADGPPGGVPEERTNVDADLTIPGSIAGPDQITQGVSERPPDFVQSGDIIEPGFPRLYQMYVHCGIGRLGELNGVAWFTSEEMPAEWAALAEDDTLLVSVTLSAGSSPTVRAVAGGVAVVYTPTSEPAPPCD